MKRLWPLGLSLLVLALLATTGSAAIIPVTGSDLVGSRETPTDVVAADGWTDANGGFKISWNISFDMGTNLWSYSYTFTDADDSTLGPELSHWLLEVSPVITEDNVDTLITGRNFSPIEGPQTWTADPNAPNSTSPGANNANPNLPADIYAIKLDVGQETYTFTSPQNPVWGDFYAKDGAQSGIVAVAYNSGIGTDPMASTTDFGPWIPTPDTGGVIPEPSAVIVWSSLAGLGLCLGYCRRGRRNRHA